MIELNVYKNTDTTSAQYGKAYARVDYKEQFDVNKLAKHMAEHNTPFSEGTIRGILTDMVKCIRELTLNGNAVKILKLLAQATGEYSAAELNKDAVLGWTKKAQDAINADKAAMAQATGGQG